MIEKINVNGNDVSIGTFPSNVTPLLSETIEHVVKYERDLSTLEGFKRKGKLLVDIQITVDTNYESVTYKNVMNLSLFNKAFLYYNNLNEAQAYPTGTFNMIIEYDLDNKYCDARYAIGSTAKLFNQYAMGVSNVAQVICHPKEKTNVKFGTNAKLLLEYTTLTDTNVIKEMKINIFNLD